MALNLIVITMQSALFIKMKQAKSWQQVCRMASRNPTPRLPHPITTLTPTTSWTPIPTTPLTPLPSPPARPPTLTPTTYRGVILGLLANLMMYYVDLFSDWLIYCLWLKNDFGKWNTGRARLIRTRLIWSST